MQTNSSSRPDRGADTNAENFVKAGFVSLKWRNMMDAFFREEARVRRQKAVSGQLQHESKVDFKTLIASAKKAVTSQCPYLDWQADSCEPLEGIISDDNILYRARDRFYSRVTAAYDAKQREEAYFYITAYIHRLHKSVEIETGTPSSLPPISSESSDADILRLAVHIERLRDARLRMVLQLAEEVWNDEFRGVEIEYSDDERKNWWFTESDFE
jgi:hypothetical protein